MAAPPDLRPALERLDLLLHREILRLRARYELSLDEFRGLYVSDERVDRLVDRELRQREPTESIAELTARAEALRRKHADGRGMHANRARLAAEFGLTPFEEDVLLLAAAPELDLKYETLFAYLNDDISRKWPTHDLALRLFTADATEQAKRRSRLLPEATLYASGLLRPVDSTAQHPAWLAAGFAASPVAVRCLTGQPLGPEPDGLLEACDVDDRPPAAARLPDRMRAAVERAAELCGGDAPPPLLVFEGRAGPDRAAAAAAVCRTLDRSLLRLDARALRGEGSGIAQRLRTLRLRQRLEPAGIYVDGLSALTAAQQRPSAEARALARALTRLRGPVMLAAPPDSAWRELLSGARHVVLRFDDPGPEERRRLWTEALAARGSASDAGTIRALSERFVLTAAQIRRAADAAIDAHRIAGGEGEPPSEALFRAARNASGHRLGELATKVETPHGWDDLVLPATAMRRIREVAGAIAHRSRVYRTWGFDRRIATGRGLTVLFAGSSGTGKTMAAGVIARELGLDLYKVDLSGVVSKYIGETEKNLDRIFRAAHGSNSILFFDEADALFGKRSEVKDAHDRYANIEISYLLQKMDQHEGTVILATNLRQNIDEAFARRIQYVIEFPMPDARHRERLWRGMFPHEAPLGDDVDIPFLARRFDLAGGDIRNVALDAAFLAAQDGGTIAMRELVNAVARQLEKQGRLAGVGEFGRYGSLLSHG